MIKLYKQADGKKHYWETWDNGNGDFTVHWGELGQRGESTVINPSLSGPAEKKVEAEIIQRRGEGYAEVEDDDLSVLIIEYKVDGSRNTTDLDKRHALEDRMSETLGWTGLGHCDGGSIGSGTMEVCCFVVDFEKARGVIEHDLRHTHFADYTRIYDEDADVA